MSIIAYSKENVVLEANDQLVKAYTDGVQTKALLSALGDYWSDYYLDTDTIAATATGAVALYSQEYSKILDFVLSSNILDIPIENPVSYQLLVFSENSLIQTLGSDGKIDYYEIDLDGISNIDFLCSSLFEPGVVLENGKHFVVENGKLKFFVDIFNDTGISSFAYTSGVQPYKQIYFWATNIVLEDSTIYNKYGVYLYKKSNNSEQYKWLITALMHFYVNTKSINRIEAVLNVLYGVPISRYANETVISISYVNSLLVPVVKIEEALFYRVITDKNVYYSHTVADLLVSEGQVLNDYQLIGRFHITEDYITNPNWYDGKTLPSKLIENNDWSVSLNELMDKVLKYNIVYVKMVVTYETYAQYKEQLSELYDIIKSGFPVYLYPFVDFIFKAVFYDTVEVDDSFLLGRTGILPPGVDPDDPSTWPPGVDPDDPSTWPPTSGIKFGHEDQFEHCVNRSFSGRTTYYSYPALDHGSKYAGVEIVAQKYIENPIFNENILYDDQYLHQPPTGSLRPKVLRLVDNNRFDSKTNYDNRDGTPDWHRPMPKGLPTFNSKHMYSKPLDYTKEEIFDLGHDCEVDTASAKVSAKFQDSFQWAEFGTTSTTSVIEPTYTTKFGHSGSTRFKKEVLVENYEFALSIKQVFTDMLTITEEFVSKNKFRHRSFYGTVKRFNSDDRYCGATPTEYNINTKLIFGGQRTYGSDIPTYTKHFGAFLEDLSDFQDTNSLSPSCYYQTNEIFYGTPNLTFSGSYNPKYYHNEYIDENFLIEVLHA